jgi:hypothetical protein
LKENQRIINLGTILRECGEIRFFELVLNRQSFGQTFENMFDLSFLVKRGRALIKTVNGVLMVQPINDGDVLLSRAETDSVQSTHVISLDYLQWQELCETYKNGTDRIPHRPE